MNYSKELRDALLRRMLPPNNESITKISKEEGISVFAGVWHVMPPGVWHQCG